MLNLRLRYSRYSRCWCTTFFFRGYLNDAHPLSLGHFSQLYLVHSQSELVARRPKELTKVPGGREVVDALVLTGGRVQVAQMPNARHE